MPTITRALAAGMPGKVDGGYDIDAAKAWLAAKKAEAMARRAKPDSRARQLDHWSIEFRREKAEHQRMVNAKLRGDLIEMTKVADFLQKVGLEFRKLLIMRSRRLAPVLVGRAQLEIQARLAEEAEEILRTFSRAESLSAGVAALLEEGDGSDA